MIKALYSVTTMHKRNCEGYVGLELLLHIRYSMWAIATAYLIFQVKVSTFLNEEVNNLNVSLLAGEVQRSSTILEHNII